MIKSSIKWMLALGLAAALLGLVVLPSAISAAEAGHPHNIKSGWEFDNGLEGWANSSTEQRQCEVFPQGGEMRGLIRGSTPVLDSPLFKLAATDGYVIVMRMKYHGYSSQASFLVRVGNVVPPQSYARGDAVWNPGDYMELSFDVKGDGLFHTYYIPLFNFRLPTPRPQVNITQLRLIPAQNAVTGQSIAVDFIRIAHVPVITAIEGCSRLSAANAGPGIYPPAPNDQYIRQPGSLDQRFARFEDTIYTRGVGKADKSLPYGISYNCLRAGGDRITLIGDNFGVAGSRVSVNGRPCIDVVHDVAQTRVSCTTPPGPGGLVNVTIAEGSMPGLQGTKAFLAYATEAAGMPQPTVSNIAARSVDINWVTSTDVWDALTITGYWIERRSALDTTNKDATKWVWSDWGSPVTVGNITVTTMLGLAPATAYQWRIAPLTEDQVFSKNWQQLDLYGRRSPVSGYVRGEFSQPTNVTTTLLVDIQFSVFDANSTLNYGPKDKRHSLGRLNIQTGEGHFGLILVGDANIQNCNASSACCDGFSKGTCQLACTAVAQLHLPYIDAEAIRAVTDATPNPLMPTTPVVPEVNTTFPNGIFVGPVSKLARKPTTDCGPALRLTASQAKLSGAAWYNRQIQVREGFDTTFTFRLSDPSTSCKFLDDAYTYCRSRGGDGFAFVIQNQDPAALGNGGMQLGYGGIPNSIAVEFDSWYNPETFDLMENHVSVNTRGWREENSSNHTYQIGGTTQGIADMTDGVHLARITYSPVFDLQSLDSDSFMASAHMLSFVTNGDFPGGGQGDWGTGMGLLKVYVDGTTVPVLTVPLNMDATLKLNEGRAWVGFTAATGSAVWQTHDILDWQFTATREDWAEISQQYPPDVVNGKGKFRCSGLFECIYPS